MNLPLKTALLHVWCVISLTAISHGQDTLRDAAAGTKASLASPATSTVTNPEDQEDLFLEEFMNYEIQRQKNWKLRLFAAGSWRYDSNVFLRNTNIQSDVMWSARPGFQYSYGDEAAKLQLLADYSAQFNFFEKFDSQNSVNQFLSLSMNYRMKKTSIKLGGRFNDVTGGDLDVGGQAQRVQFSPNMQVLYELTAKIQVGISAQVQQSHYDSLLSSTTWRFGLFADYAFSPQFRLGVQFNEMIQDVQGSGRQTGEDLLVRVEWAAFKKLSLTGSAGVHLLHTISAGNSSLPVGTLGFRYEVGPKTSIYANVYARAQNSPSLNGQYFQSEGVLFGIQQQVGSKISIGADFGYDFSEYDTYLAGVTSTRVDHVRFVRPWLKYTLHRHLALELFYQHTSNGSSGTGAQPFDRSLFGAGLTSSW
ncbi:MAG TPA: hypothetical protein PLB55_06430 [Prosthecobacter sp.]|nr:hypothetical protein [Prosthecobacter sp.]